MTPSLGPLRRQADTARLGVLIGQMSVNRVANQLVRS